MGAKSAKAEAFLRDSLSRIYDKNQFFHKLHADMYSEAGLPDLTGCINGRCVAIEVKCQPDKPTPTQIVKLNLLKQAGAVACIAMFYTDGAVGMLMDNFDKFTWRKGVIDIWYPVISNALRPDGSKTTFINIKEIEKCK
jgi:hypothetical protein